MTRLSEAASQRRASQSAPLRVAANQWEEKWTGEFIFENEWQSFRTKKDRALELTSAAKEVEPGRRKIAVKVVDIFGNDTMTIVGVMVGGGKEREEVMAKINVLNNEITVQTRDDADFICITDIALQGSRSDRSRDPELDA